MDKVICMGIAVKKEQIMPICNQDMFCKPEGGLWTSPYWRGEKFLSDWHEWCTEQYFLDYSNQPCSIISFKSDVRIYKIDCHDDAVALLANYKYEGSFDIPLFGNQNHLDYKKMSQDFDAIYLTNRGELDTRWRTRSNEVSLYGWDVETVFIFNPECIEDVQIFSYEELLEQKGESCESN